jgi:hypothetical protein
VVLEEGGPPGSVEVRAVGRVWLEWIGWHTLPARHRAEKVLELIGFVGGFVVLLLPERCHHLILRDAELLSSLEATARPGHTLESAVLHSRGEGLAEHVYGSTIAAHALWHTIAEALHPADDALCFALDGEHLVRVLDLVRGEILPIR